MCDGVADLTFVLDSSGSIRSSGIGNWNLMLNFLVNIVRRLSIGSNAIRVAVVSYSGRARVEFLLDTYDNRQELINAILDIEYMGFSTNTSGGINEMRTNVFTRRGDRPNAQNIAIVISDGASNVEQERTVPSANAAKDEDIIMLAVGITNEVNVTELAGISSNGIEGETYWLSPEFRVTQDIVQNIVRQTCVQVQQGITSQLYFFQ